MSKYKPKVYTADQIEDAILVVVKDHKWPYEHAIALAELQVKLDMCDHEGFAYNAGTCPNPSCGKTFPGVYI